MSGVASTLAKKRAQAAGFGTNASATKYLNQDFEALRSQCLSGGTLFSDSYFPAAPESLGFKELGPSSYKTRGISWKRPRVCFQCHTLNIKGIIRSLVKIKRESMHFLFLFKVRYVVPLSFSLRTREFSYIFLCTSRVLAFCLPFLMTSIATFVKLTSWLRLAF